MAKLVHKEQSYTGGGDTSDLIKWSEATTSVKKNLLPITLAELKSLNTTGTWNNNVYTLNGLTYTVTTDRGWVSQISVSGTASAETHLQLGAWMKLGDLSYRFNGVSNATTGVMWISSVSGTYTLNSSVSEVSFTSHTSDDWAIYITYGNGATPSSEVFKPMLRDASISDSTYVPYIKDNVELDADKAGKTQITNPNLLDNPWFTINQRGATTCATTGYFVDRWKAVSGTQITSNGIVLPIASSVTALFAQVLESSLLNDIAGQTVTLSAIIDNVLYSKTEVMPSDPNALWDIRGIVVGEIECDIYGTQNGSKSIRFFNNSAMTSAVTIKAVKLELGSISTLALDTAPNYAIELLKCQRYFVRYRTNPCFNGYTHNSNIARFAIHQSMRITPTVTYTVGGTYPQLMYNGTALSLTGSNIFRVNNGGGDNTILLEIDGFTNLVASHACSLKLNTGNLDFSADL